MVRLGFIIGFIALIGVLLSGLAAYRVHEQELAIDGIALSRAIDVHASLVQDRLTERELLARVASGLFRAPSVVKANVLQPLRVGDLCLQDRFRDRVLDRAAQAKRPGGGAGGAQERRLHQPDDPRFRRPGARHQGNRQAARRPDGPRTAQRGYAELSGPRLRPAFGDRADAGAGGGHRQACRVGPDPALAAGWADRPRARVARSEGRHLRARRLRHLFLRAGAADVDQRRPLAVCGGAEGPR